MLNTLRNFQVIAAIATAWSISAAAAQAGEVLDRVLSTKTITIAAVPDWPPHSFLNDQGNLDGFDIDVSNDLAKRLGVQVKFVTPAWSIITAGKWEGRWDLAIGGMTPTKERAEKFDFPAVYYYDISVAAIYKDSKLTTIAELDGKTIGVTANTSDMEYLNQRLVIDSPDAPAFDYKFKAGQVKAYEASSTALDDLRLGDGVRLDAVVVSQNYLEKALKSGYPLKQLSDPLYYSPEAVIAERGDKEFYQAIASAFEGMKQDGTLTRLSTKWFGLDMTKAN
ncbi:amino acid ABC transporter substrate-binding protein [Rhizobium esperanzae]|uniref:Amino acid ABC transporter substrate-binding protein n=1 Tax=Rhizobium esperanzae TaxID=1967781 RepID=A0A246DKQ8_9HYPH|nr:transporter substrate-binding domain-containing protein [Rhizobium esperanzae]OWO89564.1 amino acid ABC transporter substrate-binding protein [Rhizobium esperanzae]